MSLRSTYLSLFQNWCFHDPALPSPEEISRLLRAERQQCGKPQKVAVIGAGAAGLTAALVLEKFGHEPFIVEADTRLGGRIYTLRDVFDSPAVMEAGAARIRDDHFWTVAMCKELELPLVPFYPAQAVLVRGNGDGIVRRSGQFEPFEIHRDVTVPAACYGREQIATETLQASLNRIAGEHWLKIEGGFDRLSLALDRRIHAPVHLSRAVTRIVDKGPKVVLHLEKDRDRPTVTVDYAICTVPASALKDIAIDPPLHGSQQKIVQQLTYSSANRLFVHFRKDHSGDGPAPIFGNSTQLGEIWQICHDQKLPHCVIASYLFGQRAKDRADGFPESVRSAVTDMAQIAEFSSDDVLQTHWFSWDDQPFARGALPRVWDLVDVDLHEIRSPHGRIHFAGEHTASIRGLGWIDGAIESGVREALRLHHRVMVN